MLGMHGEFAANMAAHEADLLISLEQDLMIG